MFEYTDYLKMFIGLVAIVNPVGAIPIILTMTENMTNTQKKRILKTVLLSVFIILIIALFVGEQLLAFLGISIHSFRVGGGILILLMSISMLQGQVSEVKQSTEEADAYDSQKSVAVVPISMPLLAGPGAISTVILYSHNCSDIVEYSTIAFIIFLLVVILSIIFHFIPWISKHISKINMNVFTRIMGLILAAIAIEFIADGVKGLFPILD